MFQSEIDVLQLQRTFHWFQQSEFANGQTKSQMRLIEKNTEPILYGAECSISLFDRKMKNTRFAILTPNRLVILSQLGWLPTLSKKSKTVRNPCMDLPNEKVKLQSDSNTIIINLIDLIKIEHANKRHVRGYVGGMPHMTMYYTNEDAVTKIELRTTMFWKLPYLLETAYHRHLLHGLHQPLNYSTQYTFVELCCNLERYQDVDYLNQEEVEVLGKLLIALSTYATNQLAKERFLTIAIQYLFPIIETVLKMIQPEKPVYHHKDTQPGLEAYIKRIKQTPWKHRREATILNQVPPNAPSYHRIPTQVYLDSFTLLGRVMFTIHCFVKDFYDTDHSAFIPRNLSKAVTLSLKLFHLHPLDLPKNVQKAFVHTRVIVNSLVVEYFFQGKWYHELYAQLPALLESHFSCLAEVSMDLVCTWLEVQAQKQTYLSEKVYYGVMMLFHLSTLDKEQFIEFSRDDIRFRLIPALTLQPKTVQERECNVILNHIKTLL